MKQVKFSHWYKKFNGVLDDFKVRDQRNTAKLLLVLKTHYLELNKFFLEYDTQYNGDQHYALPKTELIVLLFKSEYTGNIFTTVRPYEQRKLDYYKKSVGETFQVIIGGEENEIAIGRSDNRDGEKVDKKGESV